MMGYALNQSHMEDGYSLIEAAQKSKSTKNQIAFDKDDLRRFEIQQMNIEPETSQAIFRKQELLLQEKSYLKVDKGQLTFDAEGNDNDKSYYFSRKIHWPGDKSGVTIGRGYDMGSRKEKEVYGDLLASGVLEDHAVLLAKGAGLKGEDAEKFVAKNKSTIPSITREAQKNLFSMMYEKYETAAEKNYSMGIDKKDGVTAWKNLSLAIRDVAVDFVYQQGSMYFSQIEAVSKNDIKTLQKSILDDPRTNRYEIGRRRIDYLGR